MKAFILLSIVALFLSSCASVSSAQRQADYDGDGLISAAEDAQFQRQKNVEDRAVYSESNKRRNATNTVRDAADAVHHGKRIQNMFGW